MNNLIKRVLETADRNKHDIVFIDVDEGTMMIKGNDDTFIDCYLLEYENKSLDRTTVINGIVVGFDGNISFSTDRSGKKLIVK